MEKKDSISESTLAFDLTNLFIRVSMLQDIKEIPICIKIIMELCLKKLGRRRLEPQTIQFVGRAAELMTQCMHMEKYTNSENPIVSVQIGDVLISNVLIDLGVAINVMTSQTMDQLGLDHIHPTPIVLELTDRSKIKPEGLLDDVVVSIDSWEYPTNFIMLQPNKPFGRASLDLGMTMACYG